MGDFVCTDESLSDEERMRLKWGTPDKAKDAEEGKANKATPTKAAAGASPIKATDSKPEPKGR